MCIARLGVVMEVHGHIDNIDATRWPLISRGSQDLNAGPGVRGGGRSLRS